VVPAPNLDHRIAPGDGRWRILHVRRGNIDEPCVAKHGDHRRQRGRSMRMPFHSLRYAEIAGVSVRRLDRFDPDRNDTLALPIGQGHVARNMF
jgi:hypothetical protein